MPGIMSLNLLPRNWLGQSTEESNQSISTSSPAEHPMEDLSPEQEKKISNLLAQFSDFFSEETGPNKLSFFLLTCKQGVP
jgi:hypothetical protein